MTAAENQQPEKRGRGRPRKYQPKTPSAASAQQTCEDRSARALAAWDARKPTYRRPKTITLRPDVYDALDERRKGETWANFLCKSVGIEPPMDRRRNRT